jgi:hypothetical protein
MVRCWVGNVVVLRVGSRKSVYTCLLRVGYGEYKAACMQGSIDDMVCLKLGIARCRTLQVGWGFGADLIDLHVAVRKG